jgi:hypothetical protein
MNIRLCPSYYSQFYVSHTFYDPEHLYVLNAMSIMLKAPSPRSVHYAFLGIPCFCVPTFLFLLRAYKLRLGVFSLLPFVRDSVLKFLAFVFRCVCSLVSSDSVLSDHLNSHNIN